MFMNVFRWVDCMGNLHGRAEGRNASAEALLIGSHLVIIWLPLSRGKNLCYTSSWDLKSLLFLVGYRCWCWKIWWRIRHHICYLCFESFLYEWEVRRIKEANWGLGYFAFSSAIVNLEEIIDLFLISTSSNCYHLGKIWETVWWAIKWNS